MKYKKIALLALVSCSMTSCGYINRTCYQLPDPEMPQQGTIQGDRYDATDAAPGLNIKPS